MSTYTETHYKPPSRSTSSSQLGCVLSVSIADADGFCRGFCEGRWGGFCGGFCGDGGFMGLVDGTV